MTPFEQYLLDIGYKRYRHVGSKKKGYTFVEDNNGYSFSTMSDGGICYFYIKGDNKIQFGLHEYRKPPTLISPRPPECYYDDHMNRMLKDRSPEEIYNLLPL